MLCMMLQHTLMRTPFLILIPLNLFLTVLPSFLALVTFLFVLWAFAVLFSWSAFSPAAKEAGLVS